MKTFSQFRKDSKVPPSSGKARMGRIIEKKKRIVDNRGRNNLDVSVPSDPAPDTGPESGIEVQSIHPFHEQLDVALALMDLMCPPHQKLVEDSQTPYLIYRVDTNAVIGRSTGYELTKKKANELRRRYQLKWDLVRFKVDRESQRRRPRSGSGSKIDTAKKYNPSKRTYFRGGYDSKGNYFDID